MLDLAVSLWLWALLLTSSLFALVVVVQTALRALRRLHVATAEALHEKPARHRLTA